MIPAAAEADRRALRPMVSEMMRCGCFVQYLHWQFARFRVSSVMSQIACGMNSLVERNLLTLIDPARKSDLC